MEKVIVLGVVLFLCGFVFAGEWDSFEGDNASPVSDLANESSLNSGNSFDDSVSFIDDSFEDERSTKYTSNFYIALGVGAVGLLIVILFLYLFFRGPKDKWKK